MEKKPTKKATSKKKVDVAPKTKVVKKKVSDSIEDSFLAPEATPHVEHYVHTSPKVKKSFWTKAKNFLGF